MREGSKAIADKLPMSIEIGRLELMVEKLEQELGDSPFNPLPASRKKFAVMRQWRGDAPAVASI